MITYQVIVEFGAGGTRVVGKHETIANAERDARAYASDSRNVWIVYPDGTRRDMKAEWRA